ncbi:hypothetical protein V497_07124 [Pseudogymnoascus sp. VKM F-4516 (FW-969)]|nr:hypothetical protein V497_07124 [Pseudogymnoascus sp. VKM F-4516 (FW-969)]
MRGKACCMSGGPPSPDNRPPRRINPVLVHAQQASDKERMVSWSSRFSKPEDAAELQAIFKVENLDSENGSTLKGGRCGRSKLQKRFSRDSTLTNKRPRRLTTGNSKEEIARREELRRIRAKRLQDELGDICVYDEDATPLRSSPFGQASKSAANDSDGASQDSVNAIINAYADRCVDPGDNQPLPSRKMAVSTPCRSDSALDEPKIPQPPVPDPKIMPIIEATSIGRTSWRLSFTSPQRARSLRALSLSNPQDQSISNSSLTVPIYGSLPSPGKKKKWLRAEVRRPLESQHPNTTSDEPTSGIEPRVPEKATAIPLYEMQISQRLASAGTYILSQQSPEGKDGNHDGEPVSPEEGFREINTRRSRYFRNVSGPGFSETTGPRAWGQVLGDGASSLHSWDGDDSLEQAHGSSPGRKLSLTITQGQNIMPSFIQVPRIVITKPDELDEAKPLNRRNQEHSGEGYSSRESEGNRNSPLPSITLNADVDGHLQVPECSGTVNPSETDDQHRPSTPYISKFSEDFDEPSAKSSFRSSLLSAMGLSGLGKLTRSFGGDHSVDLVAIDGRSCQHKANPGKNATPIRTTSRKESVSLDGSKTYSMESAEKMWAKAFRQSVHGISHGAEFGEIHQSPTSKCSKSDGNSNGTRKQGDEHALVDVTDSSRRSSRSTRSSFVIPPDSWANFPSHSRESRCESSGNDDARSDFAIRELFDGLNEDAATTNRPRPKHREESPSQHHPGRLTMKMRTSFDRWLTKQNKASTDTVYVCYPSESAGGELGDLKTETLPRSLHLDTSQRDVQPEISKPIHQGIPDAPRVSRRGSMDDLLERRGVGDRPCSPEERAKINRAKRREKYKTWSGRDKSNIADMMALRQSTVDFMVQAQVMEKVEQERALRAADEEY